MLTLCKFPAQLQYQNPLFQNPSKTLKFPTKTHITFPPTKLKFQTFQSKPRTKLSTNASKPKKNPTFTTPETNISDEFENDDDDFDDDEFFDLEDEDFDNEDNDDDEDIMVPLKHMKEWTENKPRGFGEGRVYDTSVEDKLMEEMEQSRKAQLINVNKLKNGNVVSNTKKEVKKGDSKVPTQIQDGFRVRLVNLPKKKKIHKDLKLAFKDVRGILNIVPVVSGNEKTRDPVCKGIAFIDFKLQDDAKRFVQNFTGKSISFGKVQKQIKCEMSNSTPLNPASVQSVLKGNSTPLPVVFDLDKNLEPIFKTAATLLDSSEGSISSELDDEDESHISAEFEDNEEIEGTNAISDSSLAEESEIEEESAVESLPSKQEKKVKVNEKKAAPKRKKDKIPTLKIPGSANRLKMKEKEMLTGVFAKYGTNPTLSVKEQSR